MDQTKNKKSSGSSVGSIWKGILYGLAFFLPGFWLVQQSDFLERLFQGLEELPVVDKLSKDFETGWVIAGALFREKAKQFYEVSGSLSVDGVPIRQGEVRSSWNRKAMETKLKQEFGSKKLKRSKAYLDYIEAYQGWAIAEMKHSKIPASIKIAQGLLESRAGQSFLATKAKNHFGIKCRKVKGYKKDGKIDGSDYYHHALADGCQQREDDNPWDRFEMYSSVGKSFRHHTLLLAESDRYNWMIERYRIGENYKVDKKWFGVREVPYYAAWSIGLKKSGYATSKRYAQKLALIIETYELWRIDYGVVLN